MKVIRTPKSNCKFPESAEEEAKHVAECKAFIEGATAENFHYMETHLLDALDAGLIGAKACYHLLRDLRKSCFGGEGMQVISKDGSSERPLDVIGD